MTKSKWEAASEKAQWDIKVALRGPDSHYGETVKWFTTAVIRGQVRNVFRVGGLVNDDLQLVVLPVGELSPTQKAAYKTAGSFAWNSSHFCEHVRTAATCWLNIPVLWIEASVWHDVMQLGSPQQAGNAIVAAAEKWAATQQPSTGRSYYSAALYAEAEMKELKRHIQEGIRHY